MKHVITAPLQSIRRRIRNRRCLIVSAFFLLPFYLILTLLLPLTAVLEHDIALSYFPIIPILIALCAIIGGLIGFGPFTDTTDVTAALNSIAANANRFYIGIFLQIVTALVIIALAAALYQAGKGVSKTAAMIAMGFYLLEVVILMFDQIIIFAITEVSQMFINTGNAALLGTAELLFSARSFGGAIAMMPFGFGAFLFYFLILKAGVIPKWLGFWGLITVPFVLVGWSLQAFGVSVPFALYVPYVPWEWVAGICIIVKGLSRESKAIVLQDSAC